MSRTRFEWNTGNSHLNDNMCMPSRDNRAYDRLFKIRPILDHLNKKYQQCYNTSENQSIDENMIKFKGRSSLKQYMPLKPIKRGHIAWVRANMYGYTCQFEIYTGRNGTRELGFGETVVRILPCALENKG